MSSGAETTDISHDAVLQQHAVVHCRFTPVPKYFLPVSLLYPIKTIKNTRFVLLFS